MKAKAIIDKLKGKAKQIEGRLTGDKIRETQGTAEKAKGDIESVAERASKRVKASVERTRAKVERVRAKRATRSPAR